MMKAALLIVLSLSALAHAGVFTKDNQIGTHQPLNKQQQQQDYMTNANYQGDLKSTPATETLKQWCFASQLSQPELTSSFKKLVGIVKSSPQDQATESAIMSERICQGVAASAMKSATAKSTGSSNSQSGQYDNQVDANAHELIKDVYMDALISCQSRECMQQLVKIINSNKIDDIRASYYMTRIAVTEKDSLKDDQDVKQLAETFINSPAGQSTSEAIERQKLFATTALIGKSLKQKQEQKQQPTGELKQLTEQVVKTIVDRYIKPVDSSEVQQYQQQQPQQQSQQVAKKIAKRNAALKAIANIPGYLIMEIQGVQETLYDIAQDKQEQSTARQSAIECLEQNEQALDTLKKITFDQSEPTEVRIAAYRALMTVAYSGLDMSKDEQQKQQVAQQIVDQCVKHCEEQRNQQQDDQFVLYVISHLDNLRSSQQPEHEAIKKSIEENKQIYMQIQLLNKKFKQHLSSLRSSRNYKLEQEFNQLESGLVIEGDLIYESKHKQQGKLEVLPKLARVNMSMPIMGKTVNVIEVTLRQDNMDEELLSALKLVQSAKFSTESMQKAVDSFKNSVESQNQKQEQNRDTQSSTKKGDKSAEADLSIKVDGCTVLYVSAEDVKSQSDIHQRRTRSVGSYSIVERVLSHLKRNPIAFNRGFNFNIDETLAKLLKIDANVIAGLRFESRATGYSSSKDFEIVAQVEPRFAVEAIVGPAKMSAKKLLQRFSTKTALGLRLRYKSNELVDVHIDLPLNTMELFTFETQMVEQTSDSFNYLPESIYGSEDIYTPSEEYVSRCFQDEDGNIPVRCMGVRKMKRSIYESSSKSIVKSLMNSNKRRHYAHTLETPEDLARATGLRGKVRMIASPKDASFLASVFVQKYEPQMQGYRVQVQKQQRGADQEQWIWLLSTPGSRFERTMQLRVYNQFNSQRSIVKAEIQSPKMSVSTLVELIHDGRQYAIKLDTACTRGKWRHTLEAGVSRGSQSASGRVASQYKPYLSIDSSSLKRPIQLQGVVSLQQSPKTVISAEFKCPTTGDFVQAKFIVDERTGSLYAKRAGSMRRSMRSPIELIMSNDYTLTGELMATVQEHIVKVHQMIDWDSSKKSVNSDFSASYKNIRKSTDSLVACNLKLDADQQMLTVQRKSPQQPQSEYRLTIVSDTRSPRGHSMVVEARYNGKRVSNALVQYKHKIDYQQVSSKKVDFGFVVELIATEQNFAEKLSGRTQIGFERQMTTVQTQLQASRNKMAKFALEYVSLSQHQWELMLQGARVFHKTNVSANNRQVSVQSRTEKDQQMLVKIVMDLMKQTGDCQFVVEVPKQRCHVAADLKFMPGKVSSWAVQTPRFVSKAEWAFEQGMSSPLLSIGGRKSSWLGQLAKTVGGNYRFKTDLKDLISKDAYWIDSAWNSKQNPIKSYLRLSSPLSRLDAEFDPRGEHTRFGMFRRQKADSSDYSKIYSTEDSIFSQQPGFDNKLALGDKLWMIRSMISSPSNMQDLGSKARKALFEYADRRGHNKNQMSWSPIDSRLKFDLEHEPLSAEYNTKPMRLVGDFSTKLFDNQDSSLPSTLSFDSDFMNFDLDTKPFGRDECYAKFNALSRHPRSPFAKHESELRYKKDQGYKAYVKHQDANNKQHQWELETDASPKQHGKMSWKSDKYGQGEYEHQWRKHATKRSHDNQDVYSNKIAFRNQNRDNSHSTQLDWSEPRHIVDSWLSRRRRDVSSDFATMDSKRRYNAVDYLKHLDARCQSQTMRNQRELYNLDFDYQPQAASPAARLSLGMPNDLLHTSSLEYEPTERTYKVASKLYNRRTQQPSYELLASTKPVVGLATAEQEPLYFNDQHPMYDSSIGRRNSPLVRAFKQPMKLDYSDKYGRQVRFDYDQSPLSAALESSKYAGLRQKRAAIYYKNDMNDFEHDSSYDFYPEAVSGFKPAKRVPGDFVMKTQTKYGPMMVHVDSSDKSAEMIVKSPVVNVKIVADQPAGKRDLQLVKIQVDNKSQTVDLRKIVRQSSVLRQIDILEQMAKKIDEGRFEHQTELVVSLYDAIFKIKSQTSLNSRPVMYIDGELNKQQDKAFVKIDGQRTKGHIVVDLSAKSASLVLDVDQQRTLSHQTRLQRVSDKFYSIESTTVYKQQPLVKLSGKISSMILSEPQHLFGRRRSGASAYEHISEIEAVVYEPKEMQVRAQYDCLKKEARVYVNNVDEQQVSDVRVHYDDQYETVFVDARQQGQRGTGYSLQKSFNVSPLIKAY